MAVLHSENNKRHETLAVESALPPPSEAELKATKEAKRRFVSALKEFFDSCMPTMVESSSHIDTSGTRKPAFFDKHLHERLILDKVVYQPTLASGLQSIAVDALGSYLKKYTDRDLPEAKNHPDDPFPGPQRRKIALNQSEIQHCVNEAAIQRVYSITTAKHCSVVAATLEFQLSSWDASESYLQWNIDPEKGHTQAVADGFLQLLPDSSTISDLYRRAKNNFSRGIGIWEFKSLKAGAKDIFIAILAHTLLPEFSWERCEHGNFCHIRCRDKFKGLCKTWARTGPDADPPVCPVEKSDFQLTKRVQKESMVKGRHIIQQVWSEMVAVDATFACLNGGLYELIFRRDRANKALHLSNIIRTNAIGYAKVETGLFIAMLRDAKQRSLQIKSVRPLTWRDTPPPEKVQIPFLNHEEKQNKILFEAKSRKWLVMKPPRRDDVCFTFCRDSLYDRVDPMTFKSSDKSPDFEVDSRCFNVISEPEKVASRGELSVDDVKFTGSSLWRFDKVYTKHANYDQRSRKRLQWEAEVYCHLRETGAADCVPSILGLFRHANIEKDKKKPNGGYLTLVLEDVGSSLASLSHFIPAVKEECHRALDHIHAAGFCHGSLSLEHIIYRGGKWPGNLISFVSFGCAVKGPDDARKKQEHEELDEVLSESSLKRKAAEE
ncbi:hypothetical protein C0993_011194 [Termitomyces sp. T159_Od127]|nr:hypothetical protein C0993_011194 [Termitomyces sp. T159_Od127]